MHCEDVQHKLGQHLDGELSPADRAAVDAHLGVCTACTRELAALAGLDELLRQTSPDEPAPELWDHVSRRLALHLSRVVAARTFPAWKVATVAALLLLAIGTSWTAFRAGAYSGLLGESEPQKISLDLLLGSQRARQLPLQDVVRNVDFRILNSPELPQGYSLEDCSLVREHNCRAVRHRYCRGKDQVVLVQLRRGLPVCYGHRPVFNTEVHGKPLCIVQCDGRLAACWQVNGTTVTLFGSQDACELTNLVAYVDERLEKRR